MVKTRLKELLKDTFKTDNISLLTPKNQDFGDFAVHTKQLSANLDIDNAINSLKKDALLENIEKQGEFINFKISPVVLQGVMSKILEQKGTYGSINKAHPLKINLEYGQPNTHKLPHIGHLFSYIYGESLARLFEAAGTIVYRCNYQGDVGLHVAKCLHKVKSHPPTGGAHVKSLDTLEDKVLFLQKCYQEGSKAYENDPRAKVAIDTLNKKIYEQDPDIVNLWQETRQWSLDYYAKFEKKLGVTYDKHYFESETGPPGKKIVEEHVGSVFEKSDEAIVFRGEKFGLHTRVFITREGNPTYEAKDIGTQYQKYQDWPFDKAIITTASEQNAYFKVVIKAIDELFPQLKGKVAHLGFGMIDLKAGKMSSRTGNIVSAMDLLKIVKTEVDKIVEKTISSPSDKEKIIETVSQGAVKYSFLKSEAKKNISFDLHESVSLSGNSGPYIQYAYARCMSVLAKTRPSVIASDSLFSQERGNLKEIASSQASRNDILENEELALLRTFFRFPEVVEDAARSFSPHLVCTYLFDLTQKFNLFYEKQPILKASESERNFRLALTAATAQILKNGLYLLGIEVLERV